MQQGNPCSPVVIPHSSSGNVCLSYCFPATPEALRCPSARTATWALRMSHHLFPCSPQSSLCQGPATNSRNESEAGMAEGLAAHPWASRHACPSCSTTGDWALPIIGVTWTGDPRGQRNLRVISQEAVLKSPFLKGLNSSCGLFQHQRDIPGASSGQSKDPSPAPRVCAQAKDKTPAPCFGLLAPSPSLFSLFFLSFASSHQWVDPGLHVCAHLEELAPTLKGPLELPEQMPNLLAVGKGV